MKKLLSLITITATLTGLSAFGQGYFLCGGGVSSVWTANGSASVRGPAGVSVAFLWGTGTPLVDSILASVPTNYSSTINVSAAWTDILTDPNYTLATRSDTSSMVIGTTGANGNWSFTGSQNSIPIVGTSSNGGTVTIFEIAWAGGYATPQLAQAAGAAIGWSAPFSYTYVSSIGTAQSFAASGFQPFGIAPVPEPATLALAGLGGLALLGLRRKKA